LFGLQLQDQVRDQLNSHLEGFRALFGLQLQDQVRDQLNSHLEDFQARVVAQLRDQARDQLNDHLEGFRALLGLQLQDQVRDQLNSHLEGFRALFGLQLQDQLRDQINDHLEGFRQLLGMQLRDQARDQLNDHLDGFLSRTRDQVAAEVEERLSSRLASVDAEVAGLRTGTAETALLTTALRDDVVELTRMLRMQADAADQVAEALGRTLVRLSVKVEDLNAAMGGSPPPGPWPAPGAEDEAVGAEVEARVVSLGPWGAVPDGCSPGSGDGRLDGPETDDKAQAKPAKTDQAGNSGRRRAGRRSKSEQDAGTGPGVEGNGPLVPVLEEAPSDE
jgi:hypothetical protein